MKEEKGDFHMVKGPGEGLLIKERKIKKIKSGKSKFVRKVA